MRQRKENLETFVEASPAPIQFEDSALVRKAQGGDPDAFSRLVLKYQDRVFNTAWRVCGNLEDAQDITQEAFIRAMKGLRSFRSKSSFYTWIFRITMNLALSHERKATHRMAVSLDHPDPAGKPLGARLEDGTSAKPSGRMETGEIKSRLVSALHQLPEQYRAVIVLRDVEGFDYAAIGEILELDQGTVKSRISRARAKLRDSLGDLIDSGGG